ncbi:ABC transporter substrate-binding protein [Devosia sp. Leaf420]|uniref:ABC transporter substrate-binding protein n=1 Tax=Devosia sp. Leaf420 TaxID=1736374 RepID=UPI000714DEFB|nr:sugar ABC transporter substrate-binding protein [Devosia sp. Leaf420]KQT48141.1 ABC transporter substrate-binding protein [Devosia sp. Leaf420]
MLKKLIGTVSLATILMAQGAMAQETINMWVRTGIGTAFTTLADSYNASHENQIQLTEVPFSELVQKYATAIAGGQAPDALSLDLIYTPSFAAAGQLEDLTDWVQALPYYNGLAPSHVALGTYEGRNYGLPLLVETSIFAWNKDLYAEAGLDPEKAPTSWDEIKANAEKIRALGGDKYGFYFSGGSCGGCMIFTFAPTIWGSGADILSEDGKTATLDTPQARAAVENYRFMVENDLIPAGAETDNGVNFMSFSNGNIGQQSIGAFGMGSIINDNPDLNFGVTLIPGSEGGVSSFAGGDNIVVTKGTPRLDAVKEFIEYAYSAEGQEVLAKSGALPSRLDIAEQTLASMDPRFQVAVDAIEVAKTPYTLLFNDLINSANSPWAIFTNAAIFGGDVDGAFAAAQSEMQSIIDNAP